MEKKITNEELRKEMFAALDATVNMYSGTEPVGDWVEAAEKKLGTALSDAMQEWPEGQEGIGEALNIVLARFVCAKLERMQRGGLVSDGHTAYGLFTEVIMPVVHELVCRELDEEENGERIVTIARELADRKNDIDDIITRHFPDLPDERRAELRQGLAESREAMRDPEYNE